MNNDKNKNGLLIIDNPSPSVIREQVYTPTDRSLDSTGFVYVLECGEYVKIGKTKRPDKRYSQIKQGAYCYGGVEVGRMAISARIKKYGEKEAELHTIFAKLRKSGTELFSVPFEVAITELERSGNQEEAIMDQADVCFYLEDKTKYISAYRETCENAVASQVLLALAYRQGNGNFNYTTLHGLASLTGLSLEDVKIGLAFLEEVEVIKAVGCGDKIFVRYLI